VKKITLQTRSEVHHANWLELFYDLIYVIVITRLTHMIIVGHDGHVTLNDYIAYFVLFVPVWWAWTGHTMLENRFGNDDMANRVMTLMQMFALVLLAVFAADGVGKGAVGFALSYAFVRFMLVAMYARVHLGNARVRPITGRFMAGFGIGALLWAISVFFEPKIMFALWGLGLTIDFLTPILSRTLLTQASVHRSHLPERTGLLFIIVLGESLLVLVNTIGDAGLDAAILMRLMLAFALIATVWWSYFEIMERAVMGKLSGAAQLHIYGHLPIYIGLGLLAAFCHRLLNTPGEISGYILLLIASLALVFIPLLAIRFVSNRNSGMA
jgi:low temperature requirement protein LtrA